MTDWTTPHSWSFDELVTESLLNTHLRDNTLHLKEQVDIANAKIVFFNSAQKNTSYDGDAVNVGSYTIAANTFNATLPNTAKALIVTVSAAWAAASNGSHVNVCNADSSDNGLVVRAQVAGNSQDGMGIVTLNSSGQFKITVGGANTTSLYVNVWGYIL